jgi:methylated-DNA-protein-cysteine methyltransferase related protein
MTRIRHTNSPKRLDGESERDFFDRVYEVVAQIPFGRVTTYGHIAESLGARSSARAVGWALNAAAGTPLPCHRVVNRFGALSGKRHFEGPHVMEERLRSEGVTFDDDACVDLGRHLWIPREPGDNT